MGAESVRGKWDKQPDGSWAVSVRVGGRGAEYVGRTCDVMTKAKTFTHITLGEVVHDYGPGDVVIFRAVR